MSNRFCFIAPMFNASATLQQMLHSVCGQSYDNWRLILIDDVSSLEEIMREEAIIESFKDLKGIGDKINVVWNRKKCWEVRNVLTGISMCEDDDIICRIDADDWLTDLDALTIIEQCYIQTGCDALWSAHRWGFSDKNISGPMPENADPYQHPWVSSHLKTFRKRLFNNTPWENVLNMNGDVVQRAGDQCIYLPVLRNATKKVFLPRCLYHYTIKDEPATYQTTDARFQKDEADYIRQRGYVSTGEAWESVFQNV